MRSAAVLNIIRDGETIRKVPVDGEAMLGRGEGCLIRLDDRAISVNMLYLRPSATASKSKRRASMRR